MISITQRYVDGVVRLIRLLREGSHDGCSRRRFTDAKTEWPVPENHLDYPFAIEFEHDLRKSGRNRADFWTRLCQKSAIQFPTGISNNELEGT